MSKARELREKRANLAEQANEILDRATAEKRGLNAEEQVAFDKIHDEIESLRKTVESIERQDTLNAELSASRAIPGREDSARRPDDAEERERARNEAFNAYLRFGLEGLSPEQRAIMSQTFQRDSEARAQSVTTTGGGYLIPQGFRNQLEEALKQFGGVESVADVFETEAGNTLPWPTYDDTAQTGALLAINTQVSDQDVTYGVVNFEAYKFSSKQVLVPVELLQDSAFDINEHLAHVLALRLGRVHNTYQTTGSGTGQPQGIATAASTGVTAASATAVTYEEMLDLVHSIDPAYRNAAVGCGWMFNDSTLKTLRKLKDSDNRPLWQPGMVQGEPDQILGFPYVINQDVASMTTGNKSILFGAMKKFKVRRVAGVTLLRLVERYADFHQVGFLAFTRMDSRMLDAGTAPVKALVQA